MPAGIDLQVLLRQVWVQNPELQTLEFVVVKELIHYEILWALDRKGILDQLTFHGGTALRLCFGANRLSEDLDFAGGPDFNRKDVVGISGVLKTHLNSRYGLEVTVKEPTENPSNTDTWVISVVTNPGQTHLPRQRIKIDIARMASRSRVLESIRPNYTVLPSGYGDLLVPVMSREEILANKLFSLPVDVQRDRIRFRDIWDIAWLVRQGVQTNPKFVNGRVREFCIEDFDERVTAMRHKLRDPGTKVRFREEMLRFLPLDIINRTIGRPDYMSQVIRTVDSRLAGAAGMVAIPENGNGPSLEPEQGPNEYYEPPQPSPFDDNGFDENAKGW